MWISGGTCSRGTCGIPRCGNGGSTCRSPCRQRRRGPRTARSGRCARGFAAPLVRGAGNGCVRSWLFSSTLSTGARRVEAHLLDEQRILRQGLAAVGFQAEGFPGSKAIAHRSGHGAQGGQRPAAFRVRRITSAMSSSRRGAPGRDLSRRPSRRRSARQRRRLPAVAAVSPSCRSAPATAQRLRPRKPAAQEPFVRPPRADRTAGRCARRHASKAHANERRGCRDRGQCRSADPDTQDSNSSPEALSIRRSPISSSRRGSSMPVSMASRLAAAPAPNFRAA